MVGQYYRACHVPTSFRPGKDKINYAGRVYDEKDLMAAVDSSLDFWLTLGPYGQKFERAMASHFRSNSFFMVNSGSSANLLAVASLMSPSLSDRLRPGDEVITPAVTFPTTVSPLVMFGLVPVFVDVEVATYNIDPDKIEAALTDKTRAIVIPHTLGNPCDMDKITSIAQKRSLFLIEDCCDALGSRFGDREVGTFGDLATLSFYPAHHITTGEGGGIIVNAPKLRKPVLSLRDWGRDCWCDSGADNTCGKRFSLSRGGLPFGYDHKYVYSHMGFNLKPTDIQAAIGLSQLGKLAEFTKKRKANFMQLHRHLKKYEDRLILPRWHAKADPSWFGYPITVRSPRIKRNDLVQYLDRSKIETRLIFAGNIVKQPAFEQVEYRVSGQLTNSDIVMNQSFFIGVYPGLTESKLSHTLKVLDKYLNTL